MSETQNDEPADEPEGFEVVTEIIDLWRWSFQNLGALVRMSWLPTIVIFVVMIAFGLVIIALAAGGALFELPEKGSLSEDQIFDALMNGPFLYLLFGGYVVFACLMMFLYAIPIRGATKISLDQTFKEKIGLVYFRFGSEEIRIGMFSICIFLLFYGVQVAVQIWLFRDVMTAFPDMVLSGGDLDPETFREMMRVQSLANGLTMLFLLVGAYFYGRLMPAIPIIVQGGKGLGIRAAWAMTRGHGMILLGTIIGAYVGLVVGMMGMWIGIMIVGGIVGALLFAVNEVLPVVMVPIFVVLMFIWVAFFFGYFQRLQVRVYEWLSTAQES